MSYQGALLTVHADFNAMDADHLIRVANRFVDWNQTVPEPGDAVQVCDWDDNTCLGEVRERLERGLVIAVQLATWNVAQPPATRLGDLSAVMVNVKVADQIQPCAGQVDSHNIIIAIAA